MLAAATDLLHRLGPGGATARAICAEVGVSLPVLYHCYGSLDGLHQAAVAAAFAEARRCFPPAVSGADPLHALLRRHWRGSVCRWSAHPGGHDGDVGEAVKDALVRGLLAEAQG